MWAVKPGSASRGVARRQEKQPREGVSSSQLLPGQLGPKPAGPLGAWVALQPHTTAPAVNKGCWGAYSQPPFHHGSMAGWGHRFPVLPAHGACPEPSP